MRQTLPFAPRLALLLCALVGLACGDYGGSSNRGETVEPDAFFDLSASAGGIAAFESSVYPIVRANCVDCHEGDGPGSPHFAHPDSTTAYQALVGQGKVNLGSPSTSRIVVKVGTLAHHCWTTCPDDGALLAAAVQAWADEVEFGTEGVSVDGALASSTVTMSDGVVDTGSERYSTNLIAFYEFKEGSGNTAFDTSGVDPPLDLLIQDAEGSVDWMTAWGVSLDGGYLISDNIASRKLYDMIADPVAGSQQFTIEAWITPANIDQEGPARIVSYSRSSGSRNTTLGQVKYTYNARTRSLAPFLENPRNGTPALQTADADQDAQDRLQHVVLTYDPFRGRRFYVDSVYTGDPDESGPGRLWNWDVNHFLTMGAEADGSNIWLGQLRMVAIYRQSLTDAQIQQNFAAGVGQRRLLRFDVTQWMGGPGTVDFVVSDFDDYSYLFCQPTLQVNAPNSSRVANLRIAVNGEVATTGQAFELVDTSSVATRQELSRQCSIIPKSAGPDSDQFTLVFEHLGGFQNVVVEDPVGPAPILLDPTPLPVNGVRDFDRIDGTFARLTGQPRSVGAATFNETLEQLPASYDVRSFVSSNQVPIAKLALDYCEALVDSPATRAAFFPGVVFTDPPEAALDTPAERALVYDALYDRMLGDALLMQPDRSDIHAALEPVVTALTDHCLNPGDCDGGDTQTTVKGVCTAVLSSAAVTLH